VVLLDQGGGGRSWALPPGRPAGCGL